MASPQSPSKGAADPNATRRMGKYELGRVLGTGSFSKVRECIDTTTKEIYAVKIIDKAQLAKEHLEEQLKREISILKQTRHKFIVSMKEVLQTTRHIYIVLELVTGGELFDKIVQSERLPEDVARKYFQQLIIALRHVHAQGIAHRDLKPENILLDKHGQIKISDFGLANLQYREGEMMRTVVGTPNYVAPEVIRQTNASGSAAGGGGAGGAGGVGGTAGYNGLMADVWSCGIILYVMLSGHQAFDDKSLKALFNKIERGQYQMSRHFSEGAKKLIASILVVDPMKRYTLNDIINDAWFRQGFDPAVLHEGTTGTAGDLDKAVESVQDGVLSPQAASLSMDGSSGDPGSPGARGGRGGAGGGAGGGASPVGAEDAIALAMRLMMLQSPANAPKQRAIPGPGVSPSTTSLPASPSAGKPDLEKSVRAFLFRGAPVACMGALYDALASFVPAFQRPAQPTLDPIRGHAVFKGVGKGSVLTYLIEVRPVAVAATAAPLCLVELKYGIGEKADFTLLVTTLLQKLDASKIACGLPNSPWVAESIVTKRK